MSWPESSATATSAHARAMMRAPCNRAVAGSKVRLREAKYFSTAEAALGSSGGRATAAPANARSRARKESAAWSSCTARAAGAANGSTPSSASSTSAAVPDPGASGRGEASGRSEEPPASPVCLCSVNDTLLAAWRPDRSDADRASQTRARPGQSVPGHAPHTDPGRTGKRFPDRIRAHPVGGLPAAAGQVQTAVCSCGGRCSEPAGPVYWSRGSSPGLRYSAAWRIEA